MKTLFKKEDLRYIKRALHYVLPYKTSYISAFICVVLGIVFSLIQPFIWANILTNLYGKNFNMVLKNIISLSILYFFQIFVMFIESYLFTYLNENIIYDLKQDMYTSTFNLPIKAFDEMRIGEFISRLHGDTSTVANIITNQLLGTIIDILKVLIIGVLVFKINLILALIVLFSFPISLFINIKFGAKLRKNNQELAKLNDSYFSNMQQSILGIREIKSLGTKRTSKDLFSSLSNKIKVMNIKVNIINAISQTLTQLTNFLSQIIVMGTGGYLIYRNLLSINYYIAFSAYSNQFSNSLMNITKLNYNIQQAITSLERIFSLIDNLNYSKEKFGSKELKDIKGDIHFQDVKFAYNNNIVLNKVNFEAHAGKKYAIVGASGSGKSTLFSILLRFYEPISGNIKIDNIDIREIDEDSLRANISIVRQDPFLFNVSIKENLMFANPTTTIDEIIEACKTAYVHDFITSLPNGYNTIIGENGVNLSGGQKQRIAIARALLKKSKIILFDEATSSLDNESQYNIKKATDELSKNHTVIIIAHRLLTVIEADEIFVVDNGKITGSGPHHTLINKNNTYKKLYQLELDALRNKKILNAKDREVQVPS